MVSELPNGVNLGASSAMFKRCRNSATDSCSDEQLSSSGDQYGVSVAVVNAVERTT